MSTHHTIATTPEGRITAPGTIDQIEKIIEERLAPLREMLSGGGSEPVVHHLYGQTDQAKGRELGAGASVLYERVGRMVVAHFKFRVTHPDGFFNMKDMTVFSGITGAAWNPLNEVPAGYQPLWGVGGLVTWVGDDGSPVVKGVSFESGGIFGGDFGSLADHEKLQEPLRWMGVKGYATFVYTTDDPEPGTETSPDPEPEAEAA